MEVMLGTARVTACTHSFFAPVQLWKLKNCSPSIARRIPASLPFPRLILSQVGDPSLRVMFAAGGTGGHVFPAIAIADCLRELDPSAQIEFVGTKNRIEWSAVPRAGYILRPIPAVGIQRPVFSLQNLLLPFHLIVSILISLRLLREFRPHLVVGTGGYVSGPLCIAAAISGCPFVIQEQNAFPGIANKILARFATSIFVAFAAAVAYFPKKKCVVCGNPIRSSFQRYVSKAVAFRHFFPNWSLASLKLASSDPQHVDRERDEDIEHCVRRVSTGPSRSKKPTRMVILVIGGSLGAKSINTAVVGMVSQMLDTWPDRFVIWQTGPKYYNEIVDLVGKHERLVISEFLNHMELAYSAADLVVARSGAITCSELLAVGKPSILIPSNNVADDHQVKNAVAMLEAGASTILFDADLTSTNLEAAIDGLLGNHHLMTNMHEKALKAAAPDAALLIAKKVRSLAEWSASKNTCFGFLSSF